MQCDASHPSSNSTTHHPATTDCTLRVSQSGQAREGKVSTITSAAAAAAGHRNGKNPHRDVQGWSLGEGEKGKKPPPARTGQQQPLRQRRELRLSSGYNKSALPPSTAGDGARPFRAASHADSAGGRPRVQARGEIIVDDWGWG
ncbi:hypothetical protein AXG93_3524s1070 [Marchantia polymorpha subsp. ruderalis]|uniref:Uncharacterized protein n=1 Tax=Marchantia polymorpha subsp. ruderalis TaxID=1480154 RepID=A0A176WU21_MARPO|nr:hypothetical protein AXG93_3524s1070 [Marchantia polymorpha subsp. ruderalis]